MATQAKKTRRATKKPAEKRKPGRPPAIPEAVRDEIENAWRLGVPVKDIAQEFQVSDSSIYLMAQKGEWPKREEIVKNIADFHNVPVPSGRDLMSKVVGSIAGNEIQRYVSVVQDLTARVMDQIAAAPPDVQNWRDVEIVDKMGRRARGLDVADTRQNVLVNVGSLMSDPDAEL